MEFWRSGLHKLRWFGVNLVDLQKHTPKQHTRGKLMGVNDENGSRPFGAPGMALRGSQAVGVLGLFRFARGLTHVFLLFQKKKRKERDSKLPINRLGGTLRHLVKHSKKMDSSPSMSDDGMPPVRRARPLAPSTASSANCSPSRSPLRKSPRQSLGSSTASPASAPSTHASSLPSMRNIFAGVDFERATDVVEYICTSRLARAKALYAGKPINAAKVQRLLDAVVNIVSAEAWFAADASRGSCPASLAGQQIGELRVKYAASAIKKQRRYAATPCLFSLPGDARRAAAHGLYVDGDLVGSELYALLHACSLAAIDCDNLDEHLSKREEQLEALGRSLCASKHDKPARRDFAKQYVNIIIHAGALLPSPGNAVDKLFREYGVPPNARAPLWLKNLAAEIREVGPELVSHALFKPTMDALRAEKPDKAARWASALHYVLAPIECVCSASKSRACVLLACLLAAAPLTAACSTLNSTGTRCSTPGSSTASPSASSPSPTSPTATTGSRTPSRPTSPSPTSSSP